MRRVVRLFARGPRRRTRRLSRTALADPTGIVAVLTLVCALPAVQPRHATLAGARVVRLKADTTVPQAPSSIARLEPTEESVRRLPAQLLTQLRDDPYVYFRFVSVQWMRATCERFGDVLPGLPPVRLHGDPHLEQYAFTADSRGLDDFDDSSMGPFVLDVTRFLASLELALDKRGWSAVRPRASAAFLAGYRASLSDRTYVPSDPSAVTRLRGKDARDAYQFLAWTDSLMLPLDPAFDGIVASARAALEEYAGRARPAPPAGFFRIKRTGRLNLGVGSALASKLLLRVEGPSPADDDDVIIEAKRAGDLTGVPCLAVAAPGAVRVVAGSEQIGRLRHEILLVLRLDPTVVSDTERWWLRNWDPSYREVDVADYISGEEIVEVAHDVGAQLGRGHMAAPDAGGGPRDGSLQVRRLDGLDPRIREAVADQTAELLDAWRRFRTR
jgi:Uncharacterized protein conserved in bacteria (DUF2252)